MPYTYKQIADQYIYSTYIHINDVKHSYWSTRKHLFSVYYPYLRYQHKMICRWENVTIAVHYKIFRTITLKNLQHNLIFNALSILQAATNRCRPIRSRFLQFWIVFHQKTLQYTMYHPIQSNHWKLFKQLKCKYLN